MFFYFLDLFKHEKFIKLLIENKNIKKKRKANMNEEKMNNTGLISFLSTVSLIGTIGNLIVIFVYWKKRDKQTSSFFILVLSCSDLVVCSVLVPMTAYIESIKFVTQNLYFCKIYHFLTTTIIPSR
jgi:predicted membrane channel-forming protein YqfA (hemolysin III family)